MNILGNRIAECRKEMGITQTEMAKLLGIGRTALSNIEHGKFSPSSHTMKSVSDILKLPVGMIFFNPDVQYDCTICKTFREGA